MLRAPLGCDLGMSGDAAGWWPDATRVCRGMPLVGGSMRLRHVRGCRDRWPDAIGAGLGMRRAVARCDASMSGDAAGWLLGAVAACRGCAVDKRCEDKRALGQASVLAMFRWAWRRDGRGNAEEVTSDV